MDSDELECDRLLRERDPGAVPRLVRRYQRPILSYLLHRIGDRAAAEDLLQELFVKVWKNRESYEPRGRLSAWLFTIARNLAADHLARRARRPDAEPETDSPAPGGPERDAEAALTRERVDAALAALPELQREVFLLREYGGLSFAEIARLTGCPLGTALARMRYAVLKLRKELGGADA